MLKMQKYQKYIDYAIKHKARNVKLIKTEDIVIDYRTILKCQFGCKDYGKNWTCPSAPNSLMPWEFEKVLKFYSYGILIHCDNKKSSQKISYEIERNAFIDGYYFAFSFSDCAICSDCAFPTDCKNKKMARPSMQALGIDVFATARKQGLPIRTLKNLDEEQNWYSLVLIE